MHTWRKTIIFPLFSTVLISACSNYQAEWPKLSAPLPDPSLRTPELVQAQPAAPKDPLSSAEKLSSLADAEALIQRTEALRLERTQAYTAALSALQAAQARLQQFDITKEDTTSTPTAARAAQAKLDDLRDAYAESINSAQLALTRLSFSTADLDRILLDDTSLLASLKPQAASIAANLEAFVVAERARLDGYPALAD